MERGQRRQQISHSTGTDGNDGSHKVERLTATPDGSHVHEIAKASTDGGLKTIITADKDKRQPK